MPLSKRLRKHICLVTLVFLLELLVGCASSSLKYSDDSLFSLMPREALVYMCFPVDKNMELASAMVQASFPELEEKNVKKIISRIELLYASLSKDDISLVASGAFPTFGLDFILSKKNGWEKIKLNHNKYYESRNSGIQLSFPSSSIAVAGNKVESMLDVFDSNNNSGVETDAAIFFDSLKEQNAISFYTDDLSLLLPSFYLAGLKLDFPFGIAKAFLYYTATEKNIYQFEADISLKDNRLIRAAIAAIKIAARANNIPITVEMSGDSTIHISELSISIDSITNIITSIIHSNQLKGE